MGTGNSQPSKPKTLEQVAAEWDGAAGNWDVGFMGNATRRFNTLSEAVVREHAKALMLDPPSTSLLDFGTGTGQLAVAMSQSFQSVLAVDVASKMIEKLNAKLAAQDVINNINTWCGDVVSDEFAKRDDATEAFDVVVSGSVLTFVPDLPATLTTLQRAMKPGGRAIHFVFADHPKGTIDPRPRGRTDELSYNDGISEQQLRDELVASGLEVESFGVISVPMVADWLPFISMKWRYVVASKPGATN